MAGYRSLATLSAQEFMRYSSSEDDEDTLDVGSKSLVKKPRTMVAKGGKPIATGARRREVASKACKMSLQRQETRLKERNNESDQTEETEEEEEEEEGVLEPRPLEVTSYRQKVYMCSLLAFHAICESSKVIQVMQNTFLNKKNCYDN